ncbi:hypothetical protein [Limisphaera sp. VF-2]|uniref:hypothetical protein n=1 Tax=Limisphaera sp. VF-2 TaxID=3400418 RepID=UPI003C247D29
MSFRQSGTVRLTTTRGFDAWNRLTNIQSVAATGLVSRLRWTYDERGQRVRADWADGSRWVYSYDAYGQLQSGRRYWADGTLVAGQQFEYRHDAIGNRTAGAWGGDERGQSLHWSTNTVNRLNQYTSRTVPPYVAVSGEAATNATVTLWWGTNECAPVVRQGRYWYGEAQVNNRGQIGSRRRKSAEMSRNNWRPPKRTAQLAGVTNLGVLRGNPDRVQSEVRSDFVAQSPETLIYDGDGNLVRDGRWVYSWDAENRLVRVMSYGATDRAGWRRVDGAYDALGRRIRQTGYVLSNGVWVVTEDLKFVSDPVWFGRHIVELNATNHTLVQSYVWSLDLSETLDGAGGVGGLLWVRLAGGPASGAHFVTYDGNGNVWQLVSASTGTETAHYEYGPFGEPIRATGSMAKANPFRFSTKRTVYATAMVLAEHRGYSLTSSAPLPVPPPTLPSPAVFIPKPSPPPVVVCTVTFCCFYVGTAFVCEKTGLRDWLARRLCPVREKSYKIEKCVKTRDWVDPTGTRHCRFRCEYPEEILERRDDECNKDRIYRVVPDD